MKFNAITIVFADHIDDPEPHPVLGAVIFDILAPPWKAGRFRFHCTTLALETWKTFEPYLRVKYFGSTR